MDWMTEKAIHVIFMDRAVHKTPNESSAVSWHGPKFISVYSIYPTGEESCLVG